MARQQLDSLESKRQQFYKDGKQVVFREQAEKAVKAILSIKEVVSAAISAEPHTSVVWARVLIILPVGSHQTVCSVAHTDRSSEARYNKMQTPWPPRVGARVSDPASLWIY